MYLYLGLIILALCPISGMAGSCTNPTNAGSWAATYGATVSSDIVVSTVILVDVPTITAQGITITQGGALYFDITKSISLSANFILVSTNGSLNIGSEACPYTQKATITLKGSQTVVNSMFGANFIGVMAGGSIELHGVKGLGSAWTKLSTTAQVGATSIQTSGSLSGLQSGDQIVIATTDYSPLESEVVTVTSILGSTIAFVPALQYSHFGGSSMNVDQSAEVGMLTRNILIQGISQGNYFGGHLMIARGFNQAHIEGVEFNNMGQDQIARYPVHFHLCGDVPAGTYVKYNSIHDTNFRCVTIHASNGVLVQGNVAYNNFGHCYFLEDGVEVNNVLRGNLAILTKAKDFGQRIGSDASNTGLSSFWITHPQNTIEDNAAVGSYTAGFWYITRLGARGVAACMPQYQNLPYRISDLQITSFKNNTAHSCSFGLGIESTNWDAGDIPAQTCDTPVANWEPKYANGSLAWTTFSTFTAHHIRDRGVWARMPNIIVDQGRFSDNYESVEYATSGDHPPYASQQIIQNSIIVGFSDNKGNQLSDTTWQAWDSTMKHSVPADVGTPMNGIKMYDGPQVLRNIVFQNFPVVAGRPADAPIGARVADQAQVATTNSMQNIQFVNCGYRYRVIDDVMDGGITANFRDTDGSVTGYTGATALRDLPFYRTSQCQESSAYMLACPNRYAQLWVLDMTNNGNNNYMYITRAHTDSNHTPYTLGFKGFVAGPLYRYQPIVSPGNSYLVRFQSIVPSSLALQLNNAEVGDNVQIAVCYPPGTTISTVQRGYANYLGNAWPQGLPQSQITNIPAGSVGASGESYFYDSSRGILVVRVQQRNIRVEYGNFCPPQGCDFVWVNAQFTGPTGASARDCTADAYAAGYLTPTSTFLTPTLRISTLVPNVLQGLVGGLLGQTSTSTSTSSTTAPIVSATTRPSTTTTTTTTPTTTKAASTTASTQTSGTTCTVSCPSTLGCCGGACYPTSMYQCNPGNYLCQIGYSSCGKQCYLPSQSTCVNGALQSKR